MKNTHATLSKIVELFKTGDVPKALAMTCFPRLNVPCAKWSLSNRMLAFLNGTQDARGFRQWKDAGRWPVKGSKAFPIICPQVMKKQSEEDEEEEVVVGFRAAPVFRYEDTDGKPLEVEEVPPPVLPPLYEVAKRWGISVTYQRVADHALGRYRQGENRIILSSHDEDVFFHELAHAAHAKVVGDLATVEKWRKEVVAELTASVLAHHYDTEVNLGGHYRYISDYAPEGKAHEACLAVLGDVQKCLNLIVAAREEEVVAVAA